MAAVRWRDYVRAGGSSGGDNLFLSVDDVRVLEFFADEEAETLAELVDTEADDAAQYAAALLKVLSNITAMDVVEYAVHLITQLLDVLGPDALALRVALFRPAGDPRQPAVVRPLLRWLSASGNLPVVKPVATALGALLSVEPCDADAGTQVVQWVCQVLRANASSVSSTPGTVLLSPPASGAAAGSGGGGAGGDARDDASGGDARPELVMAAVSCAMFLVRHDDMQRLFLENQFVEAMVPVLAARNSQLLYEAGFCMWLLSLRGDACVAMDRVGCVLGLCAATGLDFPLKVTRVAVAALLNVAKHKPCAETALAAMSETALAGVLEAVCERDDIKDVELKTDAAELQELMQSNLRVLTSLERYEREVEGGVLRWSAVHTTEFWRENARAFDADNFRLIRHLASVLETSEDVVTLAVACYDIGEFGRHHPHGKLIVDKLRIKNTVMTLLQREDEELKRHALLCCSKLMVQHWQLMSSSGGK